MPPRSGSRVSHADAAMHGAKASPPGQGSRFAALKQKLSTEKGVRDPGALAASIGRKKYGAKKMAGWAAKGRKD